MSLDQILLMKNQVSRASISQKLFIPDAPSGRLQRADSR